MFLPAKLSLLLVLNILLFVQYSYQMSSRSVTRNNNKAKLYLLAPLLSFNCVPDRMLAANAEDALSDLSGDSNSNSNYIVDIGVLQLPDGLPSHPTLAQLQATADHMQRVWASNTHVIVVAAAASIYAVAMLMKFAGVTETAKSALIKIHKAISNRFLAYFRARLMPADKKRLLKDFDVSLRAGKKLSNPPLRLHSIIIYRVPHIDPEYGTRLSVLIIQRNTFLFNSQHASWSNTWVKSKNSSITIEIPINRVIEGEAFIVIDHQPNNPSTRNPRVRLADLHVHTGFKTRFHSNEQDMFYVPNSLRENWKCEELNSASCVSKHFALSCVWVAERSDGANIDYLNEPQQAAGLRFINEFNGAKGFFENSTVSVPSTRRRCREVASAQNTQGSNTTIAHSSLLSRFRSGNAMQTDAGIHASMLASLAARHDVLPLQSRTQPMTQEQCDELLASQLQARYNEEALHNLAVLHHRSRYTDVETSETSVNASIIAEQISSQTGQHLAVARRLSASNVYADEIIARALQQRYDQTELEQTSHIVQRGRSSRRVVIEARPEQIAALPNFSFDGGKIGEQKCEICFEHFETGEMLKSMPCMHIYHTVCLDTWLGRSRLCPVCRHTVNGSLP